MSTPDDVRAHVLDALRGGKAYPGAVSIVSEVPEALRGKELPGFPHTLWELLEHLRIAQWDILEYARRPEHVSPAWPEGCWPASKKPPGNDAWNESVARFRSDLETVMDVVADPRVDLTAPIAHLDGVTWLREVMLVVSHNAYHLGQFVQLRRALECWPGWTPQTGE
jgi:hypothetical protein